MGWPLGGQRLKSRMVGLSGGSISPLWEIRYTVPGGVGGECPQVGGNQPQESMVAAASLKRSLFLCIHLQVPQSTHLLRSIVQGSSAFLMLYPFNTGPRAPVTPPQPQNCFIAAS